MICLFSFCIASESYAANRLHYTSLDQVPAVLWNRLAGEKIFFAHQSVGFNIIDGLKGVMEKNPAICLHFVEGNDVALFDQPVFAHSRIGKNTIPETKIDQFKELLQQGIGEMADIAILKLCYVDVTGRTDVDALFDRYQEMVKEIKKQFPSLTLIHCTVPLKTVRTTWKTHLKNLLGRDAWEYADNIKRNEYNSLMLQYYEGKEPVFDIARYESLCSEDTMTSFTAKGQEYLAMNPACSSDGGHLSSAGKKVVAEKFLLFLAEEMLQ